LPDKVRKSTDTVAHHHNPLTALHAMHQFEGYTLDTARCLLRSADREIELRPKSFAVLRYLVENSDRLITKEELIKAIWPDVVVTDDSLTQCVSEARQAIGDGSQIIIKTVPRRGYRFTSLVSPIALDTARTGTSVDAAAAHEELLAHRPSIAVLPFDNLSGDPQQDYFSDGIVEEIITALTRTSWLFVIARNSSFTYKGRAVDVKQVGRELGVQYVLEGSLRKSANRVRISCQLIDTANGMHIWADRYDGSLEDIFDLQDQVTANLVSAIARQLQRAAIERARRKPTENLSSYDYFLRGMASFHQWNADASDEALRHFNKAIALDPEFATAYGMAAWCFVWRIVYGWIRESENEYADAVRLARRAIDLGPDDAVALGCGGWVLAYVGRELEAGAIFVDRARALNPSHAPTWYFSGWISVFLGDPEAAIPHFAQVLRLSPRDPLTFHTLNGIAWSHFFAGRCDEALSWAERALLENPNCKPALRISAASQALLGRRENAQVVIDRMREIDPEFRVRDLTKVAPFKRAVDLAKFEAALRKAGLPD
jgi:TolB-like protein/Tfp pilus assembly protein PilF